MPPALRRFFLLWCCLFGLSGPGMAAAAPSAVPSATAAAAPEAPVSGLIKLDNFGYRPRDPKCAILSVASEGPVELRRESDRSLALAVPAAAVEELGEDRAQPPLRSGGAWRVDFSGLTQTGRYYLALPGLVIRSYGFSISDSVYDSAALAVAKSYFYQRCGGAKDRRFGGDWSDPEPCHLEDHVCQPLCGAGKDYGAMDYGELDLAGGWHDAGDYEKKIGVSTDCGQNAYADGGQTLWYLLTAYETAPAFFRDHGLKLPESGNQAPDLLNQAKWELDWYLKMQRPDGHVLAKVVVKDLGGFASPPSKDRNPRWYGPPTHEAEAIFVAALAHAARVYAQVPQFRDYARTLRTKAQVTWSLWVLRAPDSESRLWAAAELFRLDPGIEGARQAVERWGAWDRGVVLRLDSVVNFGIYAYLDSPVADPGVAEAMRGDLGRLVDQIFAADDAYGSGMPSQYYSWNSNWHKADCGQLLLWADRLGATGSHGNEECRRHALGFLHYLHGLNPLNMTYLTHASALGAQHGSWRIYNMWFGNQRDPLSSASFIGKPSGEPDPLYPYFAGTDNFGVSDGGASDFGPPPGFVPPGPTYQYAQLRGRSVPPLGPQGKGLPLAEAYRDWNWVDPGGTRSQPWIVNEAGIYDQASYLALAASFVGGAEGP